jgi:multicomponent Na+:H+ antiporter subunit G
MAIVVGLLWKIPSEWPLLVLAIISLAMWNTMLGYVLAYCSTDDQNAHNSETDLISNT